MSKKKQIEKQEQGKRIYRKTLDGMPKLRVDTPVTYVVMEFQKSLRRALIDEGFLTMIMINGEWTELKK